MYKAAIIGCGNIAGGYDVNIPAEWSVTHAGAYHLCSDVDLFAIADVSQDALNAFGDKWQVQRRYQDYREMLAKENPDILSICLPTDKHKEAFEEVCKHQIAAIVMEKPLAYSRKDIQKMLELASGKVVAVNYYRRWNSTLQDIASRLHNGEYGSLRAATIYYQKGILNNASHAIDLMRWFFGEPTDASFIDAVFDDPNDPGLNFALTFSGGARALFSNIHGCDYHLFEIDLLLDSARITIKQRGQYVQECSIKPEPYYQTFNVIAESGSLVESAWRYCMNEAVSEIAATIMGDGKVSCTMEDGFRANEICLDIIDEYRRG